MIKSCRMLILRLRLRQIDDLGYFVFNRKDALFNCALDSGKDRWAIEGCQDVISTYSLVSNFLLLELCFGLKYLLLGSIRVIRPTAFTCKVLSVEQIRFHFDIRMKNYNASRG